MKPKHSFTSYKKVNFKHKLTSINITNLQYLKLIINTLALLHVSYSRNQILSQITVFCYV